MSFFFVLYVLCVQKKMRASFCSFCNIIMGESCIIVSVCLFGDIVVSSTPTVCVCHLGTLDVRDLQEIQLQFEYVWRICLQIFLNIDWKKWIAKISKMFCKYFNPTSSLRNGSVWYGMDIPYEVQRYLRWPESWLMTHSWPSEFPQWEGPHLQPPTALLKYCLRQLSTS